MNVQCQTQVDFVCQDLFIEVANQEVKLVLQDVGGAVNKVKSVDIISSTLHRLALTTCPLMPLF